jgi:tRNA modification GTPase
MKPVYHHRECKSCFCRTTGASLSSLYLSSSSRSSSSSLSRFRGKKKKKKNPTPAFFSIRHGVGPKKWIAAAAAADVSSSSSSSSSSSDTIVAIATPIVPQLGGVSIVRISGENARAVAGEIFIPSSKKLRDANEKTCSSFQSHLVLHGTAVDRSNANEVIDEVLLLPMLKPRSYTAEDVVEIHTHGGSVCASRVLNACLRTNMCRLARNGEFTMRAFLNGRLDLSQAEAVHSLIRAETDEAAVQALKTLRGGLSNDVKEARGRMIDVLAELEARLDFDDEMVPLDVDKIAREVDEAKEVALSALKTSQKNASLSVGCTLAIVGRPNAGKSRLLNRWTKSERSIVTDVEGTTRDVVEATVNVSGVKITLLDTAGIRGGGTSSNNSDSDSSDSGSNGEEEIEIIDKVEAVGIERSKIAARGADLCAFVLDASRGWERADETVWKEALDVARNVIFVANKMDDISESASLIEEMKSDPSGKMKPFLTDRLRVPEYVLDKCTLNNVVFLSAKEGFGIEDLESKVSNTFESGLSSVEGDAYFVSSRQSEALKHAVEAMERVKESALNDLPVDFWTIDLREAAVALGEVTGEDVSEDILGTIFERFCIGK